VAGGLRHFSFVVHMKGETMNARMIAAAAIIFAVSSAAHAFSAGELLTNCRAATQVRAGWTPKDEVEAFAAIRCLSYMLALRDSQVLTRNVLGRALVCTGDRVSPAQLASIYVDWVDATSETWHEDAAVTAMLVLMKAFPCPAR